MKIFLSWSKNKSHEVALVFKEWLPLVIQAIDPFISSEDIDKGSRWSSDISKELETCSFGILCVTKDNTEEPWLMFEAGALSKKVSESNVCPFLFDVKRSEVKGPLTQFQSTIFDKDDIYKLLTTINNSCQESAISPTLLKTSYEKWWPELEKKLHAIEATPKVRKDSNDKIGKDEILEELLELSRRNQRILSNPSLLFPSGYLDRIVRAAINNERTPSYVVDFIQYINADFYKLKNDWDNVYPTICNCLSTSDQANATELYPIAFRINGGVYQIQQYLLSLIQAINQESR